MSYEEEDTRRRPSHRGAAEHLCESSIFFVLRALADVMLPLDRTPIIIAQRASQYVCREDKLRIRVGRDQVLREQVLNRTSSKENVFYPASVSSVPLLRTED